MPEYTLRRPAGHIIVARETGRIEESETCRCIHCQAQWEVKPGSGTERGWCMNCAGPICGNKECRECNPWEKQLEEIERKANRRALAI